MKNKIKIKIKNKDDIIIIEDFTPNDLLNPFEIVIPNQTELKYDINYPLDGNVYFDLHSNSPDGFTISEIINSIVENYKKIYKKEEDYLTKHPNSKTSPYGIWGHCLGNLVLEKNLYYKIINNTVQLSFDISS